MPEKLEHRKSERFVHEYIIKFEDDLTLSPIYAVSYNLSETGLYFKSRIELYPGTHIRLITDDKASLPIVQQMKAPIRMERRM